MYIHVAIWRFRRFVHSLWGSQWGTTKIRGRQRERGSEARALRAHEVNHEGGRRHDRRAREARKSRLYNGDGQVQLQRCKERRTGSTGAGRATLVPAVRRACRMLGSIGRASESPRKDEGIYVCMVLWLQGQPRAAARAGGLGRGRPRPSATEPAQAAAAWSGRGGPRPKLIQPTPKAWSVHVGSFSVVELALL
jgi:hypothetical protein